MAMDPELAGMDAEKCLKRVDRISARQQIADRVDEILASRRNQGRFFLESCIPYAGQDLVEAIQFGSGYRSVTGPGTAPKCLSSSH